MNREIICILCPLGCRMGVELHGTNVTSVQGNQCKKGPKHAEKEVSFPGRVLTTTVKTDLPEMPLLPIRSTQEIPKNQLMACMKEISGHPVKQHRPTDLMRWRNLFSLEVIAKMEKTSRPMIYHL